MSFVASEENRSCSDNGKYVQSVLSFLSDYDKFCNFKRDVYYNEILEHVTYEQGLSYIEIIKKQTPLFYNNLQHFTFNDKIGNPVTFKYENELVISPTTLRYVKVASDLYKLFGKNIGDSIAEIGTGYGGQCVILDKIFSLKQYNLFDLQPVLELNRKYIESFLLNGSYTTSTLNQLTDLDITFDLVISNYAFSELPRHIQKTYCKKILSKAKRGYLTMNSGKLENETFHLKITELRELLPEFEILEEHPLTGPQNYIIVWGHKK